LIDRRLLEHFDWALVATTVLLMGAGLVNLFSATATATDAGTVAGRLFIMQAAYAVTGLFLLAGMVLIDYRVLERVAYPIYGLAVGLLILVKAIGVVRGGAQGWIPIGPVNFQPIEFTKIAVVIALAKWFQDHPAIHGYRLWELFAPGILVGIPVGLVILQPDLGGAMLLMLMMGAIFLFVRIETWTLGIGAASAIIAAPIAYFFMLSPYQQDRIKVFLNPEADPRGKGYNTLQSKIAIGSGQFFGMGWGEGTQARLRILPAHHTDFIFSVLAQEWGFLGSTCVLGLFFLFLFQCLATAQRSKERFGALLAFGLAAMFFWQIFVNIGGALGLLPVTGVTLPFFSYGGSALLMNFAAVGLMLNVGMRRFMF
jgi:rod shape determining protein RodA